jgi:hypothetical protein
LDAWVGQVQIIVLREANEVARALKDGSPRVIAASL